MVVDEERAERLRHALEARKRELRSAVGDLAAAARPTVLAGDAIRRRPVRWFVIGFVAGVLLASARRRR